MKTVTLITKVYGADHLDVRYWARQMSAEEVQGWLSAIEQVRVLSQKCPAGLEGLVSSLYGVEYFCHSDWYDSANFIEDTQTALEEGEPVIMEGSPDAYGMVPAKVKLCCDSVVIETTGILFKACTKHGDDTIETVEIGVSDLRKMRGLLTECPGQIGQRRYNPDECI